MNNLMGKPITRQTFKECEFDLHISDAKNGFIVCVKDRVNMSVSGNIPRFVYVAHTPRELGQLIEELAERLEREV